MTRCIERIALKGVMGFIQGLMTPVSRYSPGNLLSGLVRPILISKFAKHQITQADGLNLLFKVNLIPVSIFCGVVFVSGDQLLSLW